MLESDIARSFHMMHEWLGLMFCPVSSVLVDCQQGWMGYMCYRRELEFLVPGLSLDLTPSWVLCLYHSHRASGGMCPTRASQSTLFRVCSNGIPGLLLTVDLCLFSCYK